MRTLDLLEVSIEGFTSFETKTIATMHHNVGLHYITGENQVNPRMGANGSGKSSFWEAVIWCLFGSTSDGFRTSDLKSYSADKVSVQTRWSIGDQVAEIRREGPPERIYLNGSRVEQSAIESLIGFDKMRFLQTVIHGQRATSFLDLPASERGKILDDGLNLGKWLKLSEIAGKEVERLSSEKTTLERKLARLEGELEGLPSLESLQSKSEGWAAEQQARINTNIDRIEELEEELFELQNNLKNELKNEPPVVQLSANNETSSLENQIAILREKVSEMEQMAEFYRTNKQCPTCGSRLDEYHRDCATGEIQVSKSKRLLEINDLEKQLQATRSAQQERLQKQRKAIESRERWRNNVNQLKQQISRGNVQLQSLISETEKMGQAENPWKREIEELNTRRARCLTERSQLRKEASKLNGEIARTDYWKTGFKKVRMFEVQRILSRWEQEVARANGMLGIPDFSTRFTADTGARPGIRVLVQPPGAPSPVELVSGGEEQRVKLGITLGLSSLLQSLAGVHFKFEVFDEPSSWLSNEGIEDLLDALESYAIASQRNVWIIDHRSLSNRNFVRTWKIRKTIAGSIIEA